MHGTVSLDELNWFYYTCTSFSYGITPTNLYPYVRRNIIMSLDNYIFPVLLAKKADFIVLAFRHSPQLRGLNIFYKTIVACLYSAFAYKAER